MIFHIGAGHALSFYYTYRGARELRNVTFVKIEYGANEDHPKPTLFLRCWDNARKAERSFAIDHMEDIEPQWREIEPVTMLPTAAPEPVAQPAMNQARERVAEQIALQIDAIINEGIYRVTGHGFTPDMVDRCNAIRHADHEETVYYLDGEAYLAMLPPKTTDLLENGQWSIRIDIDHRYIGKAAR